MWDLLAEYGVHNEQELTEAVKKLPKLPIGLLTEEVENDTDTGCNEVHVR